MFIKHINNKRIAFTVLTIVWLIVIIDIFIRPEPDFYDYHMAFDEHWYSRVLAGDIKDNVMPPGYVLSAYYLPFSQIVSLRLVSLISFFVIVILIYKLVNINNALILLCMPYMFVWSTRAQTDMLMCALSIGGLLIAKNTENKLLGGILTGFSTFVKPPGILSLLWNFNKKYLLGIVIGILPFLTWLYYHKSSLMFHQKTSTPFEDVWRLIIGLYIGLSLVVNLLLKTKYNKFLYIIPLLLFLLFAFYKAPIAHEYYLLPVYIFVSIIVNTNYKNLYFVITINSIIGLFLWWYTNVYMW